MLNRAIGEGALFSIATARTPATVSGILKEVNLELPAIVMTGGAFWDTCTGAYSEVQYMTSEEAHRVVEAYRRHDCSAFLYTLPEAIDPTTGMRRMLIYHFGVMNDQERTFMMERVTNPFKRFEVEESGESMIPETVRNTVLFFGIQPTEKAKKVFADLSELKGINPMFYHDWFGEELAEIEAFPKGSTKAQAIRRLMAKTGARRLVVFGDNLNDLSMMKEADVAVAVGNAKDEVKEAADIVIGNNTTDAVARFILEDYNS